jgi:hypothetical protein
VLFHKRVQVGFPLEFGRQQDGVEVFLVEVMEPDLMPLMLQSLHHGGGDGVVEAAGPGMGQDERNLHVDSFSIYLTDKAPRTSSLKKKCQGMAQAP